jgi:hypothetical protein
MKDWWRELAGAIVVLAVRLYSLPLTPWKGEEAGYVAVLTGVDQTRESLFTIVAKVAYFFAGDAFRGMVWLNVIASVAGFVLLALALRRLFDDANAGVAAALIVYLSAAMLVFTSAALPEACLMLAIAAALFAWSRRNWILLALLIAAAIALLPMPAFERHALVANVIRFTLHPWGSKWIALPLLLCAAAGASLHRKLNPLFVACGLYLAFVILTADPRHGVRPAIPAMLLLATLAGLALARLRTFAIAGALVFGVLSFAYVLPIVRQRASIASPLVAAARYAASTLPANGIVLYEVETRMPARVLLRQFASLPAEEGMQRFYDRGDVPMLLFSAGPTDEDEARIFTGAAIDAHQKLLGEGEPAQYSVDAVLPTERFLPLAGVFPQERAASGFEWRWLAPRATLRLPPNAQGATLIVRISEDSPFTANPLVINGTRVIAMRTPTKVHVVGRDIRVEAARSFVPGSGDGRTLAVQLVDLAQ